MVSKHNKALRRRQAQGTTYKLVHRSYEDKNHGEPDSDEMVWVKEEDFRRNHTNRRRGNEYEDYYDDTEEAEWEDNNNEEFYEDEIDYPDASHTGTSLMPKQLSENMTAHPGPGSSQWRKQERSTHEEEEEDIADDEDKLFEDEVEGEVTDDFLRQLVFGGENDGEGHDAVSEAAADTLQGAMENGDTDLDHEGMRYGIPQDAWRLLTDEEKAGVRAANARGRTKVDPAPNAELGIDAVTAQPYPVHDVSQGAMNKQFTEMMREFDVDAQINDAYTDDPRTHGALPMDKYMGALKEFVVDRAGVDYSTSEPAKNKGLIHQLELLAYRSGVFDTDSHGGVYTTTMASEKEKRFAEEFRCETERIRAEAMLRQSGKALPEQQAIEEELLPEQKLRKVVAFKMEDVVENGEASSRPSETPEETDFSSIRDSRKVHNALPDQDNTVTFKPEEEEEFRIAIIKSKDKRLDCETAVSVYSTYFNQPNEIRPTTNKSRQGPKRKGIVAQGAELKTSGETLNSYTKTSGLRETSEAGEDGDDSNSSHEGTGALQPSVTTLVPTIRSKDETKEEKKMRRQAVKMAQREKRQEKSALKKAYQTVSEVEKKRAATSFAAKRTVHFL